MPNNEFIARRVSVGLGVESTYGTEVAPTIWQRHMSLDFQRRTNRIENNSAMDRVESVNDSATVEQWADGTLEGKVYDISVGYLLYNIFGTLVTSDNADTNAVVKDHTFDVSQSSVAKSLTIARVDPLSSRRHGMGTLDGLDITVEKGGWAMLSAPIKAKSGVTSSDTAAYASENSFTSKHVTVKLATNVAGLAAASALAITNLKLSIAREGKTYFPFGSMEPSAINTGPWTCTGEVTLRYTDTTHEALYFANTAQAMSITLKNTDVTIGAAANPTLAFTAPKARLNTFDMSNDLDEIVEQTVGFTCELDTTTGYMLRAVLTNTQASY